MLFNRIKIKIQCCLHAKTKTSSDKEQLTYNETRLSGLKEITETVADTGSDWECLLETIPLGTMRVDNKGVVNTAVSVELM